MCLGSLNKFALDVVSGSTAREEVEICRGGGDKPRRNPDGCNLLRQRLGGKSKRYRGLQSLNRSALDVVSGSIARKEEKKEVDATQRRVDVREYRYA